MAVSEGYWFPAKRYGWGWGPPRTWQGWVVLVVFTALEGGVALATLPRAPGRFAGATLLLTAVLLGVCYAKGEPPRWRWGGDER